MNPAAMDILGQVFCGHVFISFGSVPKNGTLGHRVGGQYGNQIGCVIGSRRWRSSVLAAKTRPGADRGTDHELLLSNSAELRKSTDRIQVPEYNVNHIPDRFQGHIKTRFALLNLISQEPEELWTETRNVLEEECEKINARSKEERKIRMDDRRNTRNC